MRSLDHGYPIVTGLTEASGWSEEVSPSELADVLRSSLRAEYADASEQELSDALGNLLEAMSPAEAFNIGAALNQIGRSASRLAADPTFQQVVRTAAPIAGGAVGTIIGGPVGAALGTQLGNLAASALPAPPAPAPPPAPPPSVPPTPPPPVAALLAPAAPVPSAPAPPPTPAAVTAQPGAAPAPLPEVPSARGPASPVAGGSAAAAQGLVLTQQPDVLGALLAAALGQHGRQRVSGIPVGQLLALLSQVFAQAAADADELMYLGQQADVTEAVVGDVPADSIRSLYVDLIGADNLDLAEAAWEGLD